MPPCRRVQSWKQLGRNALTEPCDKSCTPYGPAKSPPSQTSPVNTLTTSLWRRLWASLVHALCRTSTDGNGRSQQKDSTLLRSIMASKHPKITIKTRSTPSLCKPVVVEWYDAAVSIGWDEGRSDAKVEAVSSIGWLLATDDNEVVLGADISTDVEGSLHTNRRLAIPARWIKSIKEIAV